jgi:hypothetical protein
VNPEKSWKIRASQAKASGNQRVILSIGPSGSILVQNHSGSMKIMRSHQMRTQLYDIICWPWKRLKKDIKGLYIYIIIIII